MNVIDFKLNNYINTVDEYFRINDKLRIIYRDTYNLNNPLIVLRGLYDTTYKVWAIKLTDFLF